MCKLITIVLLLPTLLLSRVGITGDKIDLSWFSYPTFCEPYRMIDLDGAMIAKLSSGMSAVPLFFPRLVSPLDWMDSADNQYFSLNQLCKNPSLRPPVEQYNYSYKSPFGEVEDIWNDSLKKSPMLNSKENNFDISRIINSNPEKLPDDKQVLDFLKQHKAQLSSEEKQKILENLLSDEEQKDFLARLLKPNSLKVDSKQNHVKEESTSKKNSFQVTVPEIEIPDAPQFAISSPSSNSLNGPKTSTLKLTATKTSLDGNPLPAQASEFYVTTKNLIELFKDMGADQAVQGEVKAVAEMWANAEKSSNPEVVYGVKSILLQAKVGKARTDAFGRAALEDIKPSEKYYLIGIEKDDESNQVTIWSKEVQVNPGENLIELSSNDVIYQE